MGKPSSNVHESLPAVPYYSMPQGFPQGFYYYSDGDQKTRQWTPSHTDPNVGLGNFESSWEGPTKIHFDHIQHDGQGWTGNTQTNSTAGRDDTNKPPSDPIVFKSSPAATTRILPDGKKVNMNNPGSRQYPHGMFHGSAGQRLSRNCQWPHHH